MTELFLIIQLENGNFTFNIIASGDRTAIKWDNVYYKCSKYNYDTTENTFVLADFAMPPIYTNKISANNVLLVHNCSVLLGGVVDYSLVYDWQEFKIPQMQLSSTGFKLNLNDFHDFGFTDDFSSTANKLTSLSLYVYDLNNKMYLTEGADILTNLELSSEGDNYYIDIPFSYLPYLNKSNGDYLIGITSLISTTKVHDDLKELGTPYIQNILYSDMSYWRYQYYANSGTGLLVPSDAEGNPTTPDDPVPEPYDPTEEAIKNQTQKIEEQTEAIKEQTEVHKNIFQQIIELPR